jgi:hypothetical protein
VLGRGEILEEKIIRRLRHRLENNIELVLPEVLLGLICFRIGGNGGQF